MNRTIREPSWHEEVHRLREFRWRSDPEWGFSFAVDEDYDPILPNPDAVKNYWKCINGEHDVIDLGIRECRQRWKEPRLIRCDCGEELETSDFTNTCPECGRDYNWNGDLLASRSQWGEETGEHLADILNI